MAIAQKIKPLPQKLVSRINYDRNDDFYHVVINDTKVYVYHMDYDYINGLLIKFFMLEYDNDWRHYRIRRPATCADVISVMNNGYE